VIEYLTADDIAAEAEMVRARFKGTILFLEGSGDLLLFERFIDATHCYAVIAYGKENAIGAVQILESKRSAGILAIVDADHWHILGQTGPSTNVVMTDLHDIELMLIQSDSFQRVINEYASVDKINRFLRRNSTSDLRNLLLERCIPIGMLRLISYKYKLYLKFKGIKYKTFVDARSLIIDTNTLVNSVVNNTMLQGMNPQNLISKLLASMETEVYDTYQLCSGHDVTELLGIGLRKSLGSQVEAIACRANLESVLRLSYEMHSFIKTRLYAAVRHWEAVNIPYIVFVQP
jgi:hypothetical protein